MKSIRPSDGERQMEFVRGSMGAGGTTGNIPRVRLLQSGAQGRKRSQNTLEGDTKQWSNTDTQKLNCLFSFRPIVARHSALSLKEVEAFRLLSWSAPGHEPHNKELC